MRSRRLTAFWMGFVLAAAGCTAWPGSDVGAPTAPPASSDQGRPIDTSLESPRLSALPDEARQALLACEVDSGIVGGMALIPSAREIPKYARFYGVEPELQTDQPAWVIQINGDLPSRTGSLLHDPTCVVIGGIATMFVSNGETIGGVTITPAPQAKAPVLELPPLEP